MNTPSQPTELDKAIERVTLGARYSTTINTKDIEAVLLAAKRAQEVEKENERLKAIDLSANNLIETARAQRDELEKENEILTESCCGLEMERTKLRDDLKQCAKLFKRINKHNKIYNHVYEGDVKNILSLPSVQAALKEIKET